MKTAIERLNHAIDNLRADRNPFSGMEPLADSTESAREAALIMAAARFNSMRPGSGHPDSDFLSDLRVKLMSLSGN
jgi:hypothetical protein